MSKEKTEAEGKQSVSEKTAKENKENISQATEDARELAQKIFRGLKKN